MTKTHNHPSSEYLAFWANKANHVAWFDEPKHILSKDHDDLYRWYAGGTLNTSYLALDRHVNDGFGDQIALCYESPMTQTSVQYSYKQMLDETACVAGMLRNLGVEKGDRVIIYMPMIPDTVFAMLACARIGAIHSVVFGGFAAHELALRIDDAKPKVILTASAGVEFDKILPYLPLVLKAHDEAKFKVPNIVVRQRWVHTADLSVHPALHDWDELYRLAPWVEAVPVAATDPLYILYTSGTTGKPKGIVRDNGGHATALLFSMEYVYGVHPGDVFWAASDVGWVVGHSYIVYAPLLHRCTTILYEGKPVRTPDAAQFWRMIEKYQVNVFFTAPTAIRAIKKEDPDADLIHQFDLSSLRQMFLAGERCDVATLEYAQKALQRPVIDHWWQTESGWPMLANPVGGGLFEVRPGSAGKPVPGFQIEVVHPDGSPAAIGEEGAVVIRLPLPPGCMPTLWQANDRFKESYLDAYEGFYNTGDGGYIDQEGYVYITGRLDDVINVAGHRLSTADMEEIVAAHHAVAECAVVGVENDLKGQVPVGLVILKSGKEMDIAMLEHELASMVRDRLGPIACFRTVHLVQKLPKTRSGKILRRTIRCIADGKPYQVPGTIEDHTVIDDLHLLFGTERHGNA